MASLEIETYDDVVRFRMRSAGSALVGLDVSAYLCRGILIDTGFPGARDAFLRAIAARGVRTAIVTHWHEDHAGNVAALGREGVPLNVRADTAEILRRPPRLPLYRRVVWRSPQPATLVFADAPIDPLVAIHTPGHTSDHRVVWDAETGTLFSGDLWLGVRARMVHAAEDPREILRSVRAMAALEPVRMFDAHRGSVAAPTAALRDKADWLEETIAVIDRRVEEGWPDSAIRREILGGEETFTAFVSAGEYSRLNFVRALRRR